MPLSYTYCRHAGWRECAELSYDNSLFGPAFVAQRFSCGDDHKVYPLEKSLAAAAGSKKSYFRDSAARLPLGVGCARPPDPRVVRLS